MTYRHRGLRHHTRRVATHHTHHRGHPVSAATRRKLSAREKDRHHKGHKATAAQRAAASKRARGRKHPHRGSKGHHHKSRHPRKTGKRKSGHRRRAVHHRTTAAHHRTSRNRHTSRRGPGGRAHVTRSGRRIPRARRERIYPSRFKHGHTRLHARFYRGKRIRALRAPFIAGRRRLRQWK